MNDANSPLHQLEGKKRSYDDLSRFIGARTTGAPNYTLLLGSGCSVSSGIRSAGQLVEQWRKELFHRLNPESNYSPEDAKEWFSKNHAVWYNATKEYSSLFEKNFDLPRQRRMFVEQEVSGKSPSLGYAYLIRLIEEGYLNTVFTTNFDDLLNEAFFQFSGIRPMVCAHDSSVGSITITSKRPKIIKLHGDYLFDDIKATVRETESLEENTRKKIVEFGRDFGLIVVGYSGCDRSVMDVLQYLLRSEDYFKHGVYWCLRKGEIPSDELLKLLWRERVYFVIVDGFDELMAALHQDLVGDSLPVSTSVLTNKPKQIVSEFCDSDFLNNSPSPIIKRDLDKLRQIGDQERLFGVIRDLKSQSQGKDQGAESLTDGQLVVTMEIRRMIASLDYGAARSRIAEELERKPVHNFKSELLDLRVTLEEVAGDVGAAISAVDAMIEGDPKEIDNYLRKSYLITDHSKRLAVLDEALLINPYSANVIDRKIDCLIDAYRAGIGGGEGGDVISSIEDCISKSLAVDPGIRNPTWFTAIDFYGSSNLPKDKVRKALDDLIVKLEVIGPSHMASIRAKMYRWSKYDEDKKSPQADSFLESLPEIKSSKPLGIRKHYEMLELDVYAKFGRKTELSRRMSELDVNPDYSESRDYLHRKANYVLKLSGDLDSAIDILKKSVSIEPKRADILRLAFLYELAGNLGEIEELMSSSSRYLNPIDKIALRRHACLAAGNVDGALSQLRASYPMTLVGISERVSEVHDLLLLQRYPEAQSVAKSFLDGVSWGKMEFGQMIVNFELAERRLGNGQNKRRLSDLLEVTPDPYVKACCHYLLGSLEKAKSAFIEVVREDREALLMMKGWAVFNDESGKRFFSSIEKAV